MSNESQFTAQLDARHPTAARSDRRKQLLRTRVCSEPILNFWEKLGFSVGPRVPTRIVFD
jgi:hypothetical protein